MDWLATDAYRAGELDAEEATMLKFNARLDGEDCVEEQLPSPGDGGGASTLRLLLSRLFSPPDDSLLDHRTL